MVAGSIVGMEITPALSLGRRLLREHGLEHWTVTTDRAKTRAGVCRFAGRTISLSAPLTRLHDEAEVRDTILHEIAHALVGPAHGHDGVWRAKAMAIGCSGERTVPTHAPTVDGPWRGECPNGHVSTRHRRPTRVQSCLRCRHGFDPEFVIAWTFHGRRVEMGQTYRAELESVTLGRGKHVSSAVTASHSPFVVGAMVRIVADGAMHGAVGEVEAAFATRSQVRVGDELYAVPNEALASAELVAS